MTARAFELRLLPMLAGGSFLVVASPLAAKPLVIDKPDLGYSVTVPSECRLQDGPGTLEAICDPGLDEAKSVDLPAALSMLLEVDVEQVPADAQPYTETEFRQDVPEAVCGESENDKIKLSEVKQAKDGAATIFTATVSCPEIKFLGLAQRSASVRYVMTPTFRYRLMARTLSADLDTAKPAKESFLASFKQSEAKPSGARTP